MKAKLVCWAVMVIALAACSGGNRKTVSLEDMPVVAWVQDMEGNFISETSTEHFKVEADFSNEVLSMKATDEMLDEFLANFNKASRWEILHLSAARFCKRLVNLGYV